MKKMFLIVALLTLVTLVLPACRPAAPKDPYKIGLTAALTGPAAATALPEAEGFRIYFQKVNEEGGINGHPVQVMIEDDRAEPPRAATNMRKFTEQGVHIVRNTSASATYPATIAEARRAKIPVVFTLIAPTEALPPNPDPLFYMASHNMTANSNSMLLDMMKSLTPSPKVGLLALEIPISLLGVQNMDKEAKRMGMPSMMKVIPAGTVDITPVASAFVDWGANWIYYFGPGAFSSMLFDAMLKVGWKGNLMEQSVAVPFETVVEKYKGNPNVYIQSPMLPFVEDLPQHKEIKDAAQKYGVAAVNSLLIIGWNDGKVFAEILKKAGWPVTTDKLVQVMQNFQLDRRPVSFPMKWTPQDHAGTIYSRLYRFKGDKIEAFGPWFASDAKGENRFTVKDIKDIK